VTARKPLKIRQADVDAAEAAVWKAAEQAPTPVLRKRGRPVTTGTTPAKDRKAKERATTAEAGGGRLNIKLTPQGAADLAAIQAKHPGMTKTEVIHNLMRGYMLD